MKIATKVNKSIEIESIKKRLHNVARSPPKYNPFSGIGMQAWDEWTATCRSLESELQAAGCDF